MKSFKGRAFRRERLRCHAVSEVRRKWSTCDRKFDEVLRDDGPKVDPLPDSTFQVDNGGMDCTDWSDHEFTSDFLVTRADHLCSKFWGNSESDSDDEYFQTPSNASLLRRAEAAGFTAGDLVHANSLLKNSVERAHVVTMITPVSINESTRRVRRLMSALTKNCRSAVQPWTGPLPPSRVSSPITLGDCKVVDKRSRHQLGNCCAEEVVETPSVATSKPRYGPHKRVFVKFADGWGRVKLSTSVGHVFRRRGRLPSADRQHTQIRRAAADSRTFADVVR